MNTQNSIVDEHVINNKKSYQYKNQKENVYIINLDRDKERWNIINNHLKDYDDSLNLIRFSAFYGKPGWIYCARSSLALIRMAREKNFPYIITMQDDTIITCYSKIFNIKFKKIMDYLKSNMDKWDIFNFNPSYLKIKSKQKLTLVSKDPKIVSYSYGKTANFIIFNRSSYDKMLELSKLYKNKNLDDYTNNAFDNRMCNIGLKYITHYPYLSDQRITFSRLQNKVVNYNNGIKIKGMKFIKKKLRL